MILLNIFNILLNWSLLLCMIYIRWLILIQSQVNFNFLIFMGIFGNLFCNYGTVTEVVVAAKIGGFTCAAIVYPSLTSRL